MNLRIKRVEKVYYKDEICTENLADFMLSRQPSKSQLGFYSTFEEQLSHQNPLYILANKINGNIFEEAFAKHYSHEGRPNQSV